jgi:4-hydroxy-3-methylbut-2-enyl diphosphate reductase
LEITVDIHSGYCFGVEYAIQMAEDELKNNHVLYCLGDIVHNDMEVKRLRELGLIIIDHKDLENITDAKVLIRAHGEPPETYRIALKNNLQLIDASCPVVLKLQNRVKNAFDTISERSGQIVIYGKKGHAEVVGLEGQTGEHAIVITDRSEIDKIDFNRPAVLFSQTTKSTRGFYEIREAIERKYAEAGTDQAEMMFEAHDSICRQVSNREPHLKSFAVQQDVLLFVSGRKSSNGRALFAACQSVNERSYFIESERELKFDWFNADDRVGICGATSTPMWLMKNVEKGLKILFEKMPTT